MSQLWESILTGAKQTEPKRALQRCGVRGTWPEAEAKSGDSMSTTLAQAKASRIPTVLGICASDQRFISYLNEAQLALISRGRWWGTIQRAQFCVYDGCLTWPREVAAIERVAVCRNPIQINSLWYEFTQNLAHIDRCASCNNCGGIGLGCGHLRMDGRGTAATFRDWSGGKIIRIYPTHSSDVGKRILLQGYDQNKIWIRTQSSGQWIDGEYVTLALPFVDSVSQFHTRIESVQKDQTNQRVLLFAHDSTANTDIAIAIYQPSEFNPQYQRSYIPGLGGGCEDADGNCVKTVEAVVKLEYVPAQIDTDWLVIGNLNALKHWCQSIKAREDHDELQALALEKAAIRELNHELRTHNGDRTEVFIDIGGARPLSRDLAGMI